MTCTKIVATGHPQYPAIAYKDGDNIAGAAPMLVEAIAKNLKIPLESKYMGTWADAQAAARDGKADMIFGIYYNDERATYLDYVQPAFMFDEVVDLRRQGQGISLQGRERSDRQEGRHQPRRELRQRFRCLHQGQADGRAHRRHRRCLQGSVWPEKPTI